MFKDLCDGLPISDVLVEFCTELKSYIIFDEITSFIYLSGLVYVYEPYLKYYYTPVLYSLRRKFGIQQFKYYC